MKLKKILPQRKADSHKGDFGHVLILAGSLGLTGAAYLTSCAALLSGSGLVTLGIPNSLNSIMEVKLTEVMTIPLAQTKEATLSIRAFRQIRQILPKFDALAIGPGLSQNIQTRKLIQKLLPFIRQPFVLDADGINALTGEIEILKRLHGPAVITPHPGEMSRLLKIGLNEIQKNRRKVAQGLAKKYKIVVVLKGYRTVVANPDGAVYVNRSGNPGMASGGCGDVLTGMIASFLGQGLRPFLAAKIGVHLHGLAADYAAKEKGQLSLTASDVLNSLSKTLRKIG